MHDPSNSDTIDAVFQAKFFLYEQDTPFSCDGDTIKLHTENGDVVLKVVGMEKRTPKIPEEDEQEAGDAWDIVSKAADDTRKQGWAKRKVKAGFSKSARNKEQARKIVDTYDKQVLPDAVNAAKRKLEKDKRALRQQYN